MTNLYLGEVYYRLKQFEKASDCFDIIGRKNFARKLRSFGGTEPYQIESKSDISTIKFILSEPLPVVQIQINKSKPVNFFIDTGGAEIILDSEFSKEIGAEDYGSEVGSFAGGKTATFQHGKVDSLTIGDFTINNVPIHIMDIRPLSKEIFKDNKIDGAIGTVLLYQFIASIDYLNQQLILRRKNKQMLFQLEAKLEHNKIAIIPFWMESDHYMVAWGQVNISSPQLFFIDTGLAGGGFISPKSTIQKAKITIDKSTAQEYSGGGGKTLGIPFLIDDLRFGDTKETKIQAFYFQNFPLENAFGFQISGLISHDYFKNYVLTLDFIKMRFFLVQN